MDKRDSEKMIQLAREGKQISKILEEDFHDSGYDYSDIYCEVHNAGERSSLGVRRMISNRLNKLIIASKNEQKEIVEEIDCFVWHIYNRYKENQQKLDEIRSIINR